MTENPWFCKYSYVKLFTRHYTRYKTNQLGLNRRPHCGMDSSEPNKPASDSKKGKELVFIVDDWPLLAELADTLLQDEGYETRSFQDPVEALKAIEESNLRPELLITDGVMSPLNGLELIDKCRQHLPHLKTILVSGTFEESFLNGQPIKPDRFLGKPYESDILIGIVRELLDQEPPAAKN